MSSNGKSPTTPSPPKAMRLTEHFTLEELTATTYAIKNKPSADEAASLAILAVKVLEPARQQFGRPMIISSGYRCPSLNKKVGGVANSQHMLGQAADIQVSPISGLQDLFNILATMEHDQLLFETNSQGKRWIHISYRPDGNNRNYTNANYKA